MAGITERRLLAVAVTVLVLGAACGLIEGSSSGPGGVTGGPGGVDPGAGGDPSAGGPPTGGSDDPAGDGELRAGPCNDIDPSAAPLVVDARTTELPTMTGGALLDGTYHLVGYQWYDPKRHQTLHRRKIVLVVAQGGTAAHYYWQRDVEPEQRLTLRIAISGPHVAMRATCPVANSLEWDRFSASGGDLVLLSTTDRKAAIFTRR